MLGDTATRVLLAVIQQKRPTVRSVAFQVGKSINATHEQLKTLRAEGLVTWEDGKAATLRAVVLPVRTGVRYDGARNKTAPASVGTADSGPGRRTFREVADLAADSTPLAPDPLDGGGR